MQTRQSSSITGNELGSLQVHINAIEAQRHSDHAQLATNNNSAKTAVAGYCDLMEALQFCLELKHLSWSNSLSSGRGHWIVNVLLQSVLNQNEALQSEIYSIKRTLRAMPTQNQSMVDEQSRAFYCQLNQLSSSAAALVELEQRIAQPLQDMGLMGTTLLSRSANPVIH